MAQMDISSIPLTKPTRLASPSQPQQQQTMQQQQPPRPRPAVKMRSSGSVVTMNSLTGRNKSSSPVPSSSRGGDMMTATTTAPIVRNSKGGSVVGGGGSNVGVVRRIGTGSNSTISASAGPTTTGGFGVSVGKVTTTQTAAGRRGGSVRREGSVTSSDDGTVSEDSVEDPIQLFSGGGGHHINGLPFGHSSMAPTRSSSGPRIASSSSVVSAAGSSVGTRTRGSASSTVSTTPKPMRIAAGAAIKVNTVSSTATTTLPLPSTNSGVTTTTGISSISIPSLSVISASSGHSLNGMSAANGGGLLSTSLSSSTSSSSLSWVSSPSHRNSNGYELGSTSPTSSTPIQPPPPPTSPGVASSQNTLQSTLIRSAPIKTPTSGAASVAAASKLAEENRRQEEAARTRRKIADLEISNTSLLQINQTLEATIRKQAAEMQELKMRMQSAQFGGDLSWMTSDKGDQDTSLMSTMNGTTSPEAAVIIHELTESERQADMTFKRLCLTIDQMLYEAKQALDQSSKPAGVKVLSSFDMYEKEAMEDAAHEDDLDTADQSIVIDEDEIDAIGGSSPRHAEEQESMRTAPATSASISFMTTALHTATTAA
ncbi:hypothetical protein KI688_005399 [Linnemannia hyalina]|uniref:Uncharacterized protein n=1 Tax=Linnemannia hyalina TaxID=64524 RepID=A0A9P8BN80_9FUNG|nr:hypothetical protein KI688_005399 [Linnemannia hyalina]